MRKKPLTTAGKFNRGLYQLRYSHKLTLQEIGDLFGETRERVRGRIAMMDEYLRQYPTKELFEENYKERFPESYEKYRGIYE